MDDENELWPNEGYFNNDRFEIPPFYDLAEEYEKDILLVRADGQR